MLLGAAWREGDRGYASVSGPMTRQSPVLGTTAANRGRAFLLSWSLDALESARVAPLVTVFIGIRNGSAVTASGPLRLFIVGTRVVCCDLRALRVTDVDLIQRTWIEGGPGDLLLLWNQAASLTCLPGAVLVGLEGTSLRNLPLDGM